MKRPCLPDTDILVDFLRGDRQAAAYISEHESRLVFSAIVVAELYAGARGDAEEELLNALVRHIPVIPVTADITRAAGLMRRAYGRSHGVGLADALVAATAESAGAELATLNTRHYPMIARLRPAYGKTAQRRSS